MAVVPWLIAVTSCTRRERRTEKVREESIQVAITALRRNSFFLTKQEVFSY
jgi:hypothetical protein